MPMKVPDVDAVNADFRARASIQASISSFVYTPRPESFATVGSWLSGESVMLVRLFAWTMCLRMSSFVRKNCS